MITNATNFGGSRVEEIFIVYAQRGTGNRDGSCIELGTDGKHWIARLTKRLDRGVSSFEYCRTEDAAHALRCYRAAGGEWREGSISEVEFAALELAEIDARIGGWR